jgi:hypothetical protein
MEFVDTHFPVIVCITEGALDRTEFDQLASGFERYFQQCRTYSVLNVTHLNAAPPEALARVRLAEWANQARVQQFSKQFCAGSATVVARSWERHALTAIQWLWTPVSPHLAADSVAQGVEYCVACLVARRVHLPSSAATLVADLKRTLGALPIAGFAESNSQQAGAASAAEESTKIDERLFVDQQGSIALGWIGKTALWAKLTGHVSPTLGVQYGTELERRFTAGTRIRYFIDSRSLQSYDLQARAPVMAPLVANRDRLASVHVLKWAAELDAVGRAAVASVGDGLMQVTNDPAEFEALMVRHAPRAKQRIEAMLYRQSLNATPRVP